MPSEDSCPATSTRLVYATFAFNNSIDRNICFIARNSYWIDNFNNHCNLCTVNGYSLTRRCKFRSFRIINTFWCRRFIFVLEFYSSQGLQAFKKKVETKIELNYEPIKTSKK